MRVGLAICNDRRWPETYRMLCLNGAEIVLIGYNTPAVLDEAPGQNHLRMFHNHLSMQAGAYQNAVWIAAAAKAGLEDGQALIGGSCVIAPTGEIAALATSIGDEHVTYRADLDLSSAERSTSTSSVIAAPTSSAPSPSAPACKVEEPGSSVAMVKIVSRARSLGCVRCREDNDQWYPPPQPQSL